MNHLDLVKLTMLMERTSGRPEIVVGLIDGPIAMNHPDLAYESIQDASRCLVKGDSQANNFARMHGTFVAGILCAKRGAAAPAICPNCTLLVSPLFAETTPTSVEMPSATPEELARAIIDSIDKGARVINLSLGLTHVSSTTSLRGLEEVLGYAAQRGVILVAAAGNQGTLGSSVITRYPWVIPVVACDLEGRPTNYSNLGSSIGRRGLSAPGESIISLGIDEKPLSFRGTSAAAPFVTGAIALLWSEFPKATAAEIKLATSQASAQSRATIVPPVLNAWAAYQNMLKTHLRR